MTPYSLEEFRVLSRDTLNDLLSKYDVDTQKYQYLRTGLSYRIARALQTNPDFTFNISDGLFKLLAKYILDKKASERVIYGFVEDIHSCIICESSNEIKEIFFLDEAKTTLLDKICEGSTTLNSLPVSPLTEEELSTEIVKHIMIPLNSETLNIVEYTSRFSGASWFEEIQKKTIILAGVGGIGSWTCLLLARVQPTTMLIYDDDIVEAANMSGQLYRTQDMGLPKVQALARTIRDYASFGNVFGISQRFTAETEACDIMICGFDNMEARKTFFNSWKTHVSNKPEEERYHCLYIDGRLSAEYLEVYSLVGDDNEAIAAYEGTLFSDEEADETICSYKQTSYMANLIGGFIVNSFTNFVANEVAGCPIRELPYKITYDGNSMKHTI